MSHTPPVLEDDALAYVGAQIASFRENDMKRERLLNDLVLGYNNLHARYKQKCDDFDQERKTTTMWQREIHQLQEEHKQLKKAMVQERLIHDSHGLAFVVIDGDGAVFRDELLERGAEGGTEAASRLLAQIRDQLRIREPDFPPNKWNIIVQIIVNFDGLARALQTSGVLTDSYKKLKAFVHAFGQAQPLFSFIDVGHGKERTDHKIRETIRTMAVLSQFKLVIFGPCHDSGYLPVLEEFKQDSFIGPKLCLLETTPALPDFLRLGLPRLQFTNVFREEPIVRPQNQVAMTLPLRNGGIPDFGTTPPTQKAVLAKASPAGGAGSPVSSALKPAPPEPASPTPSSQPAANSFAAMASNSSGASRVIDIAPKKPESRSKYILMNASSERVDEELPPYSSAALKSYREKLAANGANFCNRYHLMGSCEDGDGCRYVHGSRLKGQELLVHKYRARSTYCGEGIACRDFDCPYAHHCRYGRKCDNANTCRFADTHHMDLTPAVKIFEDDTIRYFS